MKEKILGTIKKYAMLSDGESVVVGVSGGKDSVVLLDVLCRLRQDLDLTLIAVHVNHGIRGEEADGDEAFVKAVCAQKGVECRVFHFDIPALAREEGIGLELCGRNKRYEAFESIGVDKIATAHTLSDSVETLLFHLARGSGLDGLGGIAPVRNNIIRPLIECSSEEIKTYALENALSFREDATNASNLYTRNYIRNEIIPLFKQINPSVETHCAHTALLLREQAQFIQSLAADFLAENGAQVSKIVALPKALRTQVIRLLSEQQVSIVPEYRFMEEIESRLQRGTDTVLQINGGAFARIRRGKLDFYRPQTVEDYRFAVVPGEFEIPLGRLKVSLLTCEQFENLAPCRFSFATDYDTIFDKLICRNRAAGDRFYDGKRKLTKSLKKHLAEMDVAPEKRAMFPVFECDQTVIGTLGASAQKRYAPSDKTNTILYICLSRD